MASTPKRDAIALLKADHRTVAAPFAKFERAKSDASMRALAQQIGVALTVHAKMEKGVLYLVCQGAVNGDLLKEAYVEQDGARVLIAETQACCSNNMFYGAKVKVLAEVIKHHVKEEEQRVQGMFCQTPKAGLEMNRLGEQMMAAKRRLLANYKGELQARNPSVLKNTTLVAG